MKWADTQAAKQTDKVLPEHIPNQDVNFSDVYPTPFGDNVPLLEDMPTDKQGRPTRNAIKFRGIDNEDYEKVKAFINLNQDISDIPTYILKNGHKYNTDYESGLQIFLNSLDINKLQKFDDMGLHPKKLYDYLYQSINGKASNYGRLSPAQVSQYQKNTGNYTPQPYPGIEKTREYLEQFEQNKSNDGSPLDFDYNEATEWFNSLPEWAKNGKFATELKQKWGL